MLLHGIAASTYEWRKMVPVLASRNRVLNLDLKGFGRSDKPEDGRYGPIDQGALVLDFLRRTGNSGATLVGHSFGGPIALASVLMANRSKQPGLVRRIVLISSPAYPQKLPLGLHLVRAPISSISSLLRQITLTLIRPAICGHLYVTF